MKREGYAPMTGYAPCSDPNCLCGEEVNRLTAIARDAVVDLARGSLAAFDALASAFKDRCVEVPEFLAADKRYDAAMDALRGAVSELDRLQRLAPSTEEGA